MTRGKKGNALIWLALVALAVGAAILVWPLAQNALSQHEMNQQVATVETLQASEGENDADGDSTANSKTSSSAPSKKDLNKLHTWLASYNESLASGDVAPAADPFSFQEAEDQFNGKGLEDGLIGFIKIPAMNCNMPLYLGSSYEHMALGATVVGGTSAPIGGENTNCAIAAHRGWQTAAMFRDIETLKKGDKVIIGNPWETMEYRVTKIRVIDPSDTESLAIQPGKDLVSLLTCHPYGYNYSRYLVICERVDASDASGAADATEEPTESGELSLVQVEDTLRIVGLAGIVICAVLLIMRLRTRKHSDSG